MSNVLVGNCSEVMAGMDAASVDAIVCDPPYGLKFMGKAWDHGVPGVPFWTAALRVAKPGAHLLAFGGTRTHHRLACAIEDAGWEIRDCLMWLYGSGFPKSHDVSKAIDKATGAEREVVALNPNSRPAKRKGGAGFDATVGGEPLGDMCITAPATHEAQQWSGWGTALKPAWEPIIMARKPLDGTVANNTLTHGCGGLNIDGCRVEGVPPSTVQGQSDNKEIYAADQRDKRAFTPHPTGRWPANVIHDGSQEVLDGFPETKSAGKARVGGKATQGGEGGLLGVGNHEGNGMRYGDNGGSAARFFYCAKANKKDRGDGNTHPTVKPTALMQYLCRLVTPPGGTVLDPFAGSGSTLLAAHAEGFSSIGIEINPTYCDLIAARLEKLTGKEVGLWAAQ